MDVLHAWSLGQSVSWLHPNGGGGGKHAVSAPAIINVVAHGLIMGSL